MFLVLMASIYFWREIVGNWMWVCIFTLLPIIAYRIIYEFIALPHSISVSIGYSVMATVIIIPLILHCMRKYPAGWKSLTAALLTFIFAITFRTMDNGITTTELPMGTHFLWHIFGGLCSFFILYYVYGNEKLKNEVVQVQKMTGESAEAPSPAPIKEPQKLEESEELEEPEEPVFD
jgi:hemolysin III